MIHTFPMVRFFTFLRLPFRERKAYRVGGENHQITGSKTCLSQLRAKLRLQNLR